MSCTRIQNTYFIFISILFVTVTTAHVMHNATLLYKNKTAIKNTKKIEYNTKYNTKSAGIEYGKTMAKKLSNANVIGVFSAIILCFRICQCLWVNY